MTTSKALFVLLILSLVAVAPTVNSQNFVPNPSFEELFRCPHSFSTDRKDFIVPGWHSPSRGTPDLFHSCSWGDADVPYNWAGSSNANSGKAYAGIYVWSQTGNYREYLQCELAEPLVNGKRYRLEFRYKLASNSVYSINRMGLTLRDSLVNVSHDQVLDFAPALSVEKDSAFANASGTWELAETEYVAKGGERFLLVGNFFDNANTKSHRMPPRLGKNSMLTTHSYYFIDDVAVIPLDPVPLKDTTSIKEFKEDKIEFNRDYILKNIQFEFDSYVLLRSSHVELDKVIKFLKANPGVTVRLLGHTDFLGTDEYNNKLSQDRSRSVADYLISKGIDPQLINTYGFGKTRPLLNEKTDEARSINRRVEIRFVSL